MAIEEDTPGFFQRHRVAVIVAAVLLAGGVAFLVFGRKAEPKRKASVSMVSIMPPLPPPPPPPTPPPTPPPQQEPPPEDTRQPEFQPEEQPTEQAPPKQEVAAEEPPAPLGTNIQGDGASDGFGLSGRGNGLIGGTGTGKGGGGTKWGWYAGKVQSAVVQGLRSHRRTRAASLDIKVRIWVDSNGRITRAALSGSSGDAATDRAIQNEVLTGLQFDQPPPEGMPMPIVMRIAAKRPN